MFLPSMRIGSGDLLQDVQRIKTVREAIEVEHREFEIAQRPGTGFTFNKHAIQHYLIS